MTSLQHIHVQLIQLDRRRKALYNEIADHKRGWSLFAALFSPVLRKQTLQTLAIERRAMHDIMAQMEDLREEQIAALFLECWREELDKLPSAVFLSPTK
jgi:hypothetical protein